MKISIVTISFNQAHFLERAIRSVITQDYPDIEYIVVDPGSTDGSRDIIEKYRNRITQIILENDNGPADGLNKGLLRASGEIFGYLNSDDLLLYPWVLKEVAELFNNNPSLDVVCGNGYIIDKNGLPIRRFYSDNFSPWRFIHWGCNIMQPSTFYRRKVVDEIGGFNRENTVTWDIELLLDIALAGKNIITVPNFWSVFTLHSESISSQKGNDTERSRSIENLRKIHRKRFYRKVTGKNPGWSFPILCGWARLQKWILQPRGTFWRVFEKLGIPPKIDPKYIPRLDVNYFRN
jgi:glycosyltransferase involved in cell wall biosynthesis